MMLWQIVFLKKSISFILYIYIFIYIYITRNEILKNLLFVFLKELTYIELQQTSKLN